MANVLDSFIVVNKFKFQLLYYIHFGINILRKGMTHPIMNSSTRMA